MIKVYALRPMRRDIAAERFHDRWSTIRREHAPRIDRLWAIRPGPARPELPQ